MTDPQHIRILFSDIDRTLLPSEGKDLTETSLLLGRLKAAGYEVVPCSGRGLVNMPRPIYNAPLVRYVIAGNGAVVYDKETDTVLRAACIRPPLTYELVGFIRGMGGQIYGYQNGQHYFDTVYPFPAFESTPVFDEYYRTGIFRNFDELVAGDEPLEKIGLLSFDPVLKARFTETFHQIPAFHDALALTSSGVWNLEINDAGASKGDAMRWLCGYLGYDLDTALAAGDNTNDLSMLLSAGLSVAPANSVPEVLERVDVVTADCREDGVEKYLAALPLLGEDFPPRKK